MSEAIRSKPFIFEYVNEEGIYEKSKGREVEQLGFFLRIFHEPFIPCKECQIALQKIIREAKTWTIGNKDTEPPVELWRRDEIDDNAWEQLESHKATVEEKKRIGTGKTTHIKE